MRAWTHDVPRKSNQAQGPRVKNTLYHQRPLAGIYRSRHVIKKRKKYSTFIYIPHPTHI